MAIFVLTTTTTMTTTRPITLPLAHARGLIDMVHYNPIHLSVEELAFTLHLGAERASYRVESCDIDIRLLFYAKHEQPAGESQQG